MNKYKVYVPVTVDFDDIGHMIPKSIIWEDGLRFIIDKILDVRPAAAMKAGGQGDRYTIQVNNQWSYLFFERNVAISGCNIGKWFVERKFLN